MPPADPAFALTNDERARLRTDIDLAAFERLLSVLPQPARELLLRLAARDPDLLAIWEAAPALRDEERRPMVGGTGYREPKLEMYVVPRLEDVTLSDPVLQTMLRAVFRQPPDDRGG